MASVGQLVKEHQLPDISVSRDLASEVSLQNTVEKYLVFTWAHLQGGAGAAEDGGEVRAGDGDRHVASPRLGCRGRDAAAAARHVDVEELRAALRLQDLQLVHAVRLGRDIRAPNEGSRRSLLGPSTG